MVKRNNSKRKRNDLAKQDKEDTGSFKSQSASTSPVSPNGKGKDLPSSPSRTPVCTPSQQKKASPKGEVICKMNRLAVVRDLSSHRKALLKPLLKFTSVDGKLTEYSRNFREFLG